MTKMRVFELAKEFGIEPKDLIPKLQEIGVKVVNQMSGLSEGDIVRIRLELKDLAKKEKVDEKRITGGVIRRRKKEAPLETKAEEVEEAPAPVEVAPELVEEALKEKELPKGKEKKKVGGQEVVEEKPRRVKRIPNAEEAQQEVVAKPEKEVATVTPPPKEEGEKEEKGAPAVLPAAAEEELAEAKKKKKKITLKEEFRPTDFLKTDQRVFTPFKKKVVRGRGREMLKPVLTTKKAAKRVVKMTSPEISVGDLAKQLGIKGAEIIKKLMGMGLMVGLNQGIDQDTATLVAHDYEYEVEKVGATEESLIPTVEIKPEELKPRPPVVTVMGHVDHGKTSLLDAIRKTNVMAKEAGGITQHIGAYSVTLPNGKKITFIDTPGHEAFTAMRARGAKVTDIVILVVAADDGIMPQTVEAIHHAKAANVPIIVTINKIDKPDANPERVKQQLTEHELVPEEWGGQTIVAQTAAKIGKGVPELLEMILLQAEMLELKGNPDRLAQGVIIEARLDKGRGPVSTVLIQQGTLKIGDIIVAGMVTGRVRGFFDDFGNRLDEAGPSIAVEIIGLDSVPEVGDTMNAVADEKTAKAICDLRIQKFKEQEIKKTAKVSLEELYQHVQKGAPAELRIVIKGDVVGSVEALRDAIGKIKSAQVKTTVVHTGVGAVTESDVNLAAASNAMIIAFHVRPDSKAKALAESQGVQVKPYRVIYEAVQDIKGAMEGLLAPLIREQVLGRAEVRETFSVPKVGVIAGCSVSEGKVTRNAKVRLLRDNVVIHEGNVSSLKRFKEDAREVKEGFECGIGVENYNDLKPGDILEFFIMEEHRQTLQVESASKQTAKRE